MTERMFLLNSRKLFAQAVKNWPAKVLSVALAIILFVFHRMSILEERFFSVPLNIETFGDLIPSSSYPRMVRVTLRGDANSIFPIVEEDIEAYLDLGGYTEAGNYRAPVDIRKKGTALGVDPLEIGVDPLEVSVELDRKLSKSVSLIPRYQGYVESGYELVSYTLEPTKAVIEGPSKLITGISELATEYVELSGRNTDFSTTVRVLNREPRIVVQGNGVAEFKAFIRAAIMIRTLDGLTIEVVGLEDSLRAEPEVSMGSIRLEGAQKELEAYTPAGTILTLDCSGIIQTGEYTLPVRVNIPSRFALTRSEPEEVRVYIYDTPQP
jgi:YbbR domain-containing protein